MTNKKATCPYCGRIVAVTPKLELLKKHTTKRGGTTVCGRSGGRA